MTPDPAAVVPGPWHYDLPAEAIARHPPAERGASRLMFLPRSSGPPTDHRFAELRSLLRPGDRLVVNDTRVVPARLFARRRTGGRVELLLLGLGAGPIDALARPAGRLAVGETLSIGEETATVRAIAPGGRVVVELSADPLLVMEAHGHVPLPPYLGRDDEPDDRVRYQTVWADRPGAVAAPTAGLHFTEDHLADLARDGIGATRITLHVGIGTFRPPSAADVAAGRLHAERYEVSSRVVDELTATRRGGGRVVAVGTTSARALESATPEGASVPVATRGETDLFVRPGYRWRCVDGLVTNLHLPDSSLLMLVASLCGRERLFDAYRQALARGYRFASYGDAMLVI